jgi:uncharacterized protein (DUF433 family)
MSSETTSPTQTGAETVVPILGEYIVKTPGTAGGEARIAGTRIKVKHVYVWVERQGMTPAEVVAASPHLTRAAVHAALAYSWAHPDEIRRQIDAEEKLVAEMKARSGPSKLQEKLAERDAKDDPVPPG